MFLEVNALLRKEGFLYVFMLVGLGCSEELMLWLKEHCLCFERLKESRRGA